MWVIDAITVVVDLQEYDDEDDSSDELEEILGDKANAE